MQWGIILALAFALIIAAFAVVNMDTITLNYLFGETSIPLVLVIIGATLAGAIIVASFNIANLVSSYRRIKKLEKEIDMLEHQLAEQKMVSVEGKEHQDSDVYTDDEDKWDTLGAENGHIDIEENGEMDSNESETRETKTESHSK